MTYSLNEIYKTVGISKQAVDQYSKRQLVFDKKICDLILEVDELKIAHPGCGVEKMYNTLRPDFIGRDRFANTFMQLGYRVKRHKNYRKTTRSGFFYYDNLIEGFIVNGSSQVWQSDITYIRVKDRYYYAVFIIDIYTKEIVGFNVSDHMRATANVQALKMALKDNVAPMIHHSDRGSQYTYFKYTKLLEDLGTKISMGKTAQDNAYAERINGTIKNEFIRYWKPANLNQLKKCVAKAVYYYNYQRPHNNICKKSPNLFKKELNLIPSKKRKTITIFNHQNGQH